VAWGGIEIDLPHPVENLEIMNDTLLGCLRVRVTTIMGDIFTFRVPKFGAHAGDSVQDKIIRVLRDARRLDDYSCNPHGSPAQLMVIGGPFNGTMVAYDRPSTVKPLWSSGAFDSAYPTVDQHVYRVENLSIVPKPKYSSGKMWTEPVVHTIQVYVHSSFPSDKLIGFLPALFYEFPGLKFFPAHLPFWIEDFLE